MDDSSGRKFQKDLNGGLVGLVLLARVRAEGGLPLTLTTSPHTPRLK